MNIIEAISMCDKVIVLTNRPSKIKNIYNIKLDNIDTPINNRKDKIVSRIIRAGPRKTLRRTLRKSDFS